MKGCKDSEVSEKRDFLPGGVAIPARGLPVLRSAPDREGTSLLHV